MGWSERLWMRGKLRLGRRLANLALSLILPKIPNLFRFRIPRTCRAARSLFPWKNFLAIALAYGPHYAIEHGSIITTPFLLLGRTAGGTVCAARPNGLSLGSVCCRAPRLTIT